MTNFTKLICVAGLIGCDNPDALEACLGSAENLIRAQPDGLHEVWKYKFVWWIIVFQLRLKKLQRSFYRLSVNA